MIRVATYNLHDLLDDTDCLRMVLAHLGQALAVDVVCVQELPRSPRGDLAGCRLAATAGLRAPWTHCGGGGTSIFVGPRVTVRALRHVRLGVPIGQRRRGFTLLSADVEGARVDVVSMHLGLHRPQRRRHASTIADAVQAGGSARVVVAGDANEPVSGPAIRRLALAELGDRRPTYPAARPQHAIDVVLGRGWSADSEVPVELPPGHLAAASDHRPRVVELLG